jgi:thiol-disulfide isomerase/thioredoxin
MARSASSALGCRLLLLAMAAIGFAGASSIRAAADQKPPASSQTDTADHKDPPSQPRQLRLHFRLPDGVTWPAGLLPEIYPEESREKVRLSWQPTSPRSEPSDPYSRGVRPVGPATFAFEWIEAKRPFYVAVFAPGFLRFFEAGPFNADEIKNGVLEIPLPKPAALKISFLTSTAKSEKLPFDRQMVSVMRMTSRNLYLWAAYRMDLPQEGAVRIADLAPGAYQLQALTHPRPGVANIPGTEEQPVHPGRYHEYQELVLAEGQTRQIDFRYAPPDLNAYRGHRTARVRIERRDGQPATDVKITIGYYDGHYGTIPVFSGQVPKTGEIVLKGITDRLPTRPWLFGYVVRLGKDQRVLGCFQFQTDSDLESFAFQLPLQIGDMAANIDLVNVVTGEHKRLGSFRGKFVCLDFWLTWCEYCQETMQKLDQASAQNRERWNDCVTVVPIAMDEEPEIVVRHLKERGWNHLEHYWAGPWKSYPLDSATASAFGLDSAPRSFLIGPDGRILWQGHPLAKVSGMDLIERIRQTLKAVENAKDAKKSAARSGHARTTGSSN